LTDRQIRRQAAPPALGDATALTDEDRAIIRLLQVDGRMPLRRVADEVGLNIKTVRSRVRELREGQFINITTVTDPQLLGYRALGLVAINGDGEVPLRELAEMVAETPSVDHLVACTGRYDLIAEIVCRDVDDMYEQITLVQGIRGVARTETFPYLSLYYQEPHWEARSSGGDGGVRKDRDLVLNAVDRGILRALNEDGRVPLRDVARQLDVSEGQVRQRLARMVDTGGLRVLALTNPQLLGIQMAWVAVGVKGAIPRMNVAKQLAELEVVTYVVIASGRFDLWVEVSFSSPEELLNVLDEQFATADGIERLEVFMYLDVHYRGLRPAVDEQRGSTR
jgi:Lrp/AsnC family transcriptional regulator for asnA, asnC and gidA